MHARHKRSRASWTAALALGALHCSCGSDSLGAPAAGEIRHVLLISLDTTRADHLGCYGDARGLTPNLDRLAARGVRFEAAMSPAPTTLAAHTSIFTGTYPQTHGVARNGFVVNPANETLAELFSEAGWATGAVLGSFALESRFGLDQGFDRFDENFDLQIGVTADRTLSRDQNQRQAGGVTTAALAQFAQVQDERSFHFVHYFDPHVPYEAPREFVERFGATGAPASARDSDIEERVVALQAPILGEGVGLSAVIGGGLTPELLEGASGEPDEASLGLASLYAAEVAYLDAEVGRLLDGLESSGQLANTLIVLTGDHGETFWEHGDFWNHGLWLYQTTVHVPLIFVLPDGRGAGSQVSEPVSTIDVFPTLAELIELPLPERVEGVSLAGALAGRALAERALFACATQPYSQELAVDGSGRWVNVLKPQAIRRGPWKYVIAPYIQGGYQQLFHLGRDPGETNNLLLGSPGPQAKQALVELRGILEAHWKSAAPLPSGFDSSQNEDTAQRLRDLGYSGDSSDDDDEALEGEQDR